VPENSTRSSCIGPLLGGYVYQQHMAVLRLLDLLDLQHPVTGVRLEDPKPIENKDLFDDVSVTLSDGNVHRFQVKWGFQQSYYDDLTAWKLADFKNPSGRLYIADLFITWQGYQDSGIYPYCHIYTSKPADESLLPFLVSCQEDIPFEGDYLHFDISLYDQLKNENRSDIDKEQFEHFLAHLYLSFNQPRLAVENEPSGHHGGMKDDILKCINELGLPDSAYLRNQQLDASTLYDKLCNIASNANLSSQQIDLKSLQQRLDLDPTRGSIEQPEQVDESVFVERGSEFSDLDQAIDGCEGGLICLVGKPGSGKSWLLEKWHSTREATPIFYCFRGLDDERLEERALEDQAVRNLLHDFDRFYENVLGSRQYANTVEELQERLNALSSSLSDGDKRVIVFDGLDHAVRTGAQLAARDTTVVQLLETLSIPEGIVVIIGTQPGRHLDNLSGTVRTINLTGFSRVETKDYITNKLDFQLSDDQCDHLHTVSDGLPLILRFIANQLSQLEDFEANVDAFTAGIPATGGEIDTYYDYLWQGLPDYNRSGTEGAPHKALKTLAIRKPGFVLTEQRLREVIPRAVVSDTDYSEALKQITPLVDGTLLEKGEFALFANSLQIYIVEKMQGDSDYIEFLTHAHTYCTGSFSTPIGHRFRLQYAYDLGLMDDILSTINMPYIDSATVSLFPKNDIHRNIRIAITTAYDDKKVVEIARLGLLHFYTRHRFENIDERDLVRNLVHRGDSQQVQHRILYENNFVFSESDTLDLLLDSIALNVPLDYGSLFLSLSDKIAELDDEARKNIDPLDFWGLALASGNGITYYRDIFLKNTEGKPEDFQDRLYKKFIEALAEFATVEQFAEFKKEEGFAIYAQPMSVAEITVLQREDRSEEAKRQWEKHFDQYDSYGTEFLYQGCRLKADTEKVSSLVDYSNAIIAPPDGYHISDEYMAAIDEAFAIVCSLAYIDEEDQLRDVRNAVSAFPRSYLKEFLEVGFHIKAAEGRHLAGQSVDFGPNIIRRLVDYEQRGEEKPRIVDISTSSGLGSRVADLIYTTATVVPEEQLSNVAGAISHIFLNRLGYAIGGYSYKFPSTHKLLRTISDILSCYHGTHHISHFSNIVNDIENDVLMREGYEGSRTSALLEVSNLWAVVGDVEKAFETFQGALEQAHSYGQRKDITFLQAIRSLSHENRTTSTGTLERTKKFMDLALHLGWMTDWSEVRAVMPELCDELASRQLVSAFDLLDIFRHKRFRGYYDQCLRSCLQHCNSNFQLLYALSDTAIETRNMYDELVRLFGIKSGIVIRAFNSGEATIALQLVQSLQLFLRSNVAQSERGKLVKIYNQTATAVGTEEIKNIPEEPSDNDRNRPDNIRIAERKVSFTDFMSQVASADIERLQEVAESINPEVGSYYAREVVSQRVKELSETATEQQLIQLNDLVGGTIIDTEASDVLWAIAVAYKRIGDTANYIEMARRACTTERGWGGIFSEDNEDRLAALAHDDIEWVEKFLSDRLYRSALDGLYIDTAYAIPTIQAVDNATGNLERAHQLWLVFNDLLVSLFRHVPDKESPFTDLLNGSKLRVTKALTSALLDRLESDEYAVKYRAAETIANILPSSLQLVHDIIDKLEITTHRTAKILLVALLEYTFATNSHDLRPHRERLEQLLSNEQDFYILKQLEGIVLEVGQLPTRLVSTNTGIIELSRPSTAFVNGLLANCMSFTRGLLSDSASTLGLEPNQLKARVELECQRMGVDLNTIDSQLREQVNEFRSPQGETIPFEAVTDYAVISALSRVLTVLLEGYDSVDRQTFFDKMRRHDPLVWQIRKSPRPDHIQEIPNNKDIDDWFDSGDESRLELCVDDLASEVIVAEMESIDSERIGFNRQVGSVLVSRDRSLDTLNPRSINGYLINPGKRYDTIKSLKYDFVHPMLITDGTPLFCYQPVFWWLQGSYEYLRINPRIEADLQLAWATDGTFDMELEGSSTVRYQAWRNGFKPEEYSRSEEHSGCYVLVSPSIIRTILTRYDMNILIVTHESRIRKKEQWREGREEETKASCSLTLIKVN